MINARRLLRRSPAEWRALVAAATLSVAVRLVLAVLPFRSALKLVRRLARPSRFASRPAGERERVVWAVHAVGRRLFPSKPCLTEALVGFLLLRRRGIPAELHLGVEKDDEKPGIRAHAWLESEGRVVVGGEESPSRYRRLPSLETIGR
ncbi:MAG TPA: lasso peptide biosynthesis B2 protein [Gemmatimonadota bacterium]|nr:lasso peptide biosynthesis B2 protein [Gemmatimonadota bacterium]